MPKMSLKELSDRAAPGEWRGGKRCDGAITVKFDGTPLGICSDMVSHDAAFVAALVNAYRAGRLHDDTALATAVARAKREALEEAIGFLQGKANEGSPFFAAAAALQSLAATPPEDRQTEAGRPVIKSQNLLVSFEDQSASYVNGFEAGMIWSQIIGGAQSKIEVTTHTDNRETIVRMSIAAGWSVETAPSGVEGWDYTVLYKDHSAPQRANPRGLRLVSPAETPSSSDRGGPGSSMSGRDQMGGPETIT